MSQTDFDIAIIGGGPAGTTASIYLARAGFNTALFEMKKFPREVVCGEFLSSEVSAILKELNLLDEFLELNPSKIENFSLVFDNGKKFDSTLGFNGYGLKRSIFDEFLLNQAKQSGVNIYQPAKVNEITTENHNFKINYNNLVVDKVLTVEKVIIAYGKQNYLDKLMGREFAGKKTLLNGIKFHVERKYLQSFNTSSIEIYTGNNIYCGLNCVDENTVTVCYLENRVDDEIKPRQHLKDLLKENKGFADIFAEDFEKTLDELPVYGCGNIYFGDRKLVERGMYVIGDAAGIIAPLAGDGIGMAMQNGKIIAEVFKKQKQKNLSIKRADFLYKVLWRKNFSKRMRMAKRIQYILFNEGMKKLGYRLLKFNPFLLKYLIKSTRAK